jgi:hypothetical protein
LKKKTKTKINFINADEMWDFDSEEQSELIKNRPKKEKKVNAPPIYNNGNIVKKTHIHN